MWEPARMQNTGHAQPALSASEGPTDSVPRTGAWMFALPACRGVDAAEEGACQEAEACAGCQGGRSRRLGLQPRMDGDAGRELGQGCRHALWVPLSSHLDLSSVPALESI